MTLSKVLDTILSKVLGMTLSKASSMIISNPFINVQSFIIKSLMFNLKNDTFKENIISSKLMKLKDEFKRIERVKTIIFYVKNFKFNFNNEKRFHLKIFKFENDDDFFFLSFINA